MGSSTTRSKTRVRGKTRLCIDFADADELLAFVDALRADGSLPAGADAFAIDALDEMASSVSQARTFIVKRGRDRIPGSSLREILGGERLPDSEFITGKGPDQ